MINDKEIKRKIKTLSKIKRQSRIKTKLRRDLNKQIRKKKEELKALYNITPEKIQLIQEIKNIKHYYTDLKKFTIEELNLHLKKLKEIK